MDNLCREHVPRAVKGGSNAVLYVCVIMCCQKNMSRFERLSNKYPGKLRVETGQQIHLCRTKAVQRLVLLQAKRCWWQALNNMS